MKKFCSLTLILVLVFSIFPLISCGQAESKTTTYQIDCTLTDEGELLGKQTVCFYNDKENTFKSLKFNLFANAFRKEAKYTPVSAEYYHNAYPNGIDFGGIEIIACSSQETPLNFSICGIDQNILEIMLLEEVFPLESVSVTIEYKIDLANVVARTGINDSTINLANFYPILCGIDEKGFYECVYYSTGDPYFSECASYLVKFTCNSEYVVGSSGLLIDGKSENGLSTTTYKLENARSFCLVLSKNFECITDQSLGITVNYYYYDDQTPIVSLEYALKSLETFNSLFGKYPYPTYSVVQTKFLQGGMEFPALVMISDSLDPLSYGEVIVHETAHQWWQTTVGNNEIEFGFLDEGLAEYSTLLFYENRPEFSYTREQLVKQSEQTYRLYCSVYDKLFGKVDTTMLRAIPNFTSEYEYVNIAYVKSCIMFDQFRVGVGDEKFFGGLRKYYQNFAFKNATPDDLIASFISVNADAEGFFKSFFEGKAII